MFIFLPRSKLMNAWIPTSTPSYSIRMCTRTFSSDVLEFTANLKQSVNNFLIQYNSLNHLMYDSQVSSGDFDRRILLKVSYNSI